MARSIACAEQDWNEQALAQPVREPAWRAWVYRECAIVLGCSQRKLLAGAHGNAGVELLLRRSGGGAVLVGPWMLGLSVVLPGAHALVGGGMVASYRWLGELLADVLRDAGVAAQALPPDAARAAAAARMLPTLQWACFGALSPWEVVASGRKIAGLAQVRRRHGVLLVGGLLLDAPDWPVLCAGLDQPAGDALALARCTTSWAEQGGPVPTPAVLAQTLEARWRELLGPDAGERSISPVERLQSA